MAASCYGMPAITCGTRSRAGLKHLFGPSNYVLPLSLKRDVKFRVRSMAEENNEIKEEVAVETPIPTSPPTPKPKKVSTSFFDVFAFSGPGPERINGRLAMIGFVTALGVEVGSGQDLFAQVQNGGIIWFLGTSALLTLASLIPIFKGVTAESRSKDLMTSDAEIWNGRIAMLGLVALAFTEYVKGGALV